MDQQTQQQQQQQRQLQAHGQSILRRVAVGRRCARLPALGLAYRAAAALIPQAGNNIPGPGHVHEAVFRQWLAALPPTDQAQQRKAWAAARASYAASLVNNALHRDHLERIARRVQAEPPAWHELLATEGGALVLTMHHDFHHTLFALAGRAGRRVGVVAAPEESSALFPWIGHAIHAMHRGCAAHFNGGDYLFMAPGASGAGTAVAHVLRRGELVFSLHDFAAPPGMRSLSAMLLGRRFEAPSGALELATRLRVPIYFAALVWQPDTRGYHLQVQRLSPENVVQDYMGALQATVLRWPWAWSGWQWFGDLGTPT